MGKENFKYAKLYSSETGEYCGGAKLDNVQMGPETARRFEENEDDCAVTICCITYNHEDYIASALDSFLMQKTNFKFKIFVGEDKGPDRTADIVREYAEKYPDIIVPFIREENMGAQANLIDLCKHANSPYIAFCEGDDYWVDEYKLQKQYDLMQYHTDWRACYSRAEIEAPEDWFLRSWFKANKEGKLIFPDCEPTYSLKTAPISAWDCVWVFPAHTATVFYRWDYDVNIPDWYYTGLIGDHPIFLMQIGMGKAGFLPDVTAVYRRSNVGVYMSDNMDEHFMKTRSDHVRWMSGILDWYGENLSNYPKVLFENRIKLESFNFLKTALKLEDYDAVLNYFQSYPEAASISLNAYLKFYSEGRTLIKTMTWDAYRIIISQKKYLAPLRVYANRVLAAENRKKKRSKRKDSIKKFAKKIRGWYSAICYWAYSLVPKQKNLWAITSFRAKGYLDNSKYFYEYVIANNPEIELYWLTKDKAVYDMLKEENKPVCMMNSKEGRKILSHANVVITDHNIVADYDNCCGFNHRAKTVQLWHGVGFKAMGDGKTVKTVREPGVQYSTDILIQPGDGFFKRLKKRIKFVRKAPQRELFEKYFMLVCPGQERVDMIGKMWNIPDENMFMAGHPRDIYSYQLKPDAQNPRIMYAPTFRYEPKKEMELIDGCIEAFDAIEALMDKINGTFVIRLHPHTWRDYNTKLTRHLKNYNRIEIDNEKDIYTTLGTYSVVISDYSSISLDFAMLDRPTIYYCPDIVWFKEKQAGFNLDFENSIPGPLVDDWDAVLEKVEEYIKNPKKDSKFRKEKCKYFFDESVNGPDNSKRIVEEIKRRLGM